MTQPAENHASQPPTEPPMPHAPPPPGSGFEPARTPKPPPGRFHRRLLMILLLAVPALVVGLGIATYVPQEFAAWRLKEAEQHRAAGRMADAEASLAAAQEWLPGNEELLLRKLEWRLADGDYEGALTAIEEAQEKQQRAFLARDPFTLWSVHSQVLQHLGRHGEAIQDWKRINQRSLKRGIPSRASALNGLAYARAVGKLELKEGLANANEALLFVPQDPAILDTRGYLLHLMGDNQAALKDFDLAIQQLEAAESESQQVRATGRELALDRVLDSINPPGQGIAVIYYHRALVLAALGRQDDAKKDRERARKLIGREPDEKLF